MSVLFTEATGWMTVLLWQDQTKTLKTSNRILKEEETQR